MDSDFAGLSKRDETHATELVARLQPNDHTWAKNLIAAAHAQGAQLVTVLEPEYPSNFYFAHNVQPFLWVRGGLLAEDYRSVAVIGDSDYTIAQACEAARALVEAGLTVVAALRSDVDAAIHTAALRAGGRTIAVLAGGITMPIGPVEHANVAEKIARSGAVVSQFWPDAIPTSKTIELSRVVTSGLADSVYVVDGHDGGPSHLQAEIALDHSKHVFVPHKLHQEQQWVSRIGFRGGITAVQDIDDLTKQVVNVVDMTPRMTAL
ncbi:DNA-processing protein DprA [Nonomuraea sp. NPDC003709]|uniref:DNA-processing protein DprA n=1 Tax=Nonomuraea sp. NPDC003709 TaxID=3154450 RepID=UPI0033BE0432